MFLKIILAFRWTEKKLINLKHTIALYLLLHNFKTCGEEYW